MNRFSPGAMWVERFLLPLLEARMPGAGLSCLKIEPIGDTDARDEAERLNRAGHRCDVVLCDNDFDLTRLPFASNCYDLVLNGCFGRMTPAPILRTGFARELARITKTKGALLLGIGNRICPLDISGNAARLHSPSSPTLLTLREAEGVFVSEAGYTAVQLINLQGNFGWTKATGLSRIIAVLLETYWRYVVTAKRRWLYQSPFNPYLLLWIVR